MVAPTEVKQHRDQILEIAKQYGASRVRLFGSVVQGNSTPASDLDLLVHFDVDRSLLDQVGLKQDLEDLLGRPVDVVDDEALHRSLRDRIFAEAVGV